MVSIGRQRPRQIDEVSRNDYFCLMNASANSTIILNLRELTQLFNSMDSSPFVDRDLDARCRGIHHQLGAGAAAWT